MSFRTVTRRAAASLPAAGRRAAGDVWIVLQATLGASVAWAIARYALDHPAPFFAPIAAIIALIANLGERGLNAVRLMLGVILGLVIGDLVLLTMGTGLGVMAVAVFTTLIVARLIAEPPLIAVQAAFSAILVVAVGDVASGLERMLDALVGTGVALVFSQLLFPPEPLALLRRAEKPALTAIADGLAATARAIVQDDDDLAHQAVRDLRKVRDHLAEMRRVGRASKGVTRRALGWREHATVIVRENENAGHLDILNASCLLLARLIAGTDTDTRRRVEQPVQDLADVIASIAPKLGDAETRQRAADRALDVASDLTFDDLPADSDLALLTHTLRLVATDVITFAGGDAEDAAEAIREGALKRTLPAPSTVPRRLLTWAKRLRPKPRTR